ncbi:MAG: hypothetical protein M1832_001339 [Thelocarpon impressellum]|nr:MAG: hypothetical protein M1832_001339 [Thelocarpon impressellum]
MSTQAFPSNTAVAANASSKGADVKPPGSASAKVKDEKAARDECMLFSDGDAQESCKSAIDKYRSCMAGFGFSLP